MKKVIAVLLGVGVVVMVMSVSKLIAVHEAVTAFGVSLGLFNGIFA
jgi:hypothetical protein